MEIDMLAADVRGLEEQVKNELKALKGVEAFTNEVLLAARTRLVKDEEEVRQHNRALDVLYRRIQVKEYILECIERRKAAEAARKIESRSAPPER